MWSLCSLQVHHLVLPPGSHLGKALQLQVLMAAREVLSIVWRT